MAFHDRNVDFVRATRSTIHQLSAALGVLEQVRAPVRGRHRREGEELVEKVLRYQVSPIKVVRGQGMLLGSSWAATTGTSIRDAATSRPAQRRGSDS